MLSIRHSGFGFRHSFVIRISDFVIPRRDALPMRICHLGKYYPPAPGGIETHVRTLARAQADLGASVRVFCVNHEPGPTAVEHDGPVEVTRFRPSASVAKLDLCPELVRALRKAESESDV